MGIGEGYAVLQTDIRIFLEMIRKKDSYSQQALSSLLVIRSLDLKPIFWFAA